MTMTVRASARWDGAAFLTLGSSLAVTIMAVTGVAIDNVGEVTFAEIVRSLAAGAAIALLPPVAMFALGGPFRIAALAFPVGLFAFYKFSGVSGVAEYLGLVQTQGFVASLAGLLLIYVAAADSFRRRPPKALATFLFVITACIAAGSAATVGASFLRANARSLAVAEKIAAEAPRPSLANADLPDIIYIVPDRYGSTETLKEGFGHDNGAFISALEARGFYFSQGARSNFAKTVASLASSMNMTDLGDLRKAIPADSDDRAPLHHLIRENAVQRQLRKAGYIYEHLGNWWGPTKRNDSADINFYGADSLWSLTTEFEQALIRLTPVAWLVTDGAAVERGECERLKNQLRHLETVRGRGERPVFAFAHLTMPHVPITMDKDGRCIPHVYYPGYGTSWTDYQAAYSGYVTFLNRRLIEIFDANRAVKNGRGLIFVIQSDEGPYPRRLHEDTEMSLQDFTDAEIREKFGIINTIYWDAETYGRPYLTRTPVNNWRIILSKIAGEEIPLIRGERSLLMRNDRLVYDNKDVTDVLTGAGAELQARVD